MDETAFGPFLLDRTTGELFRDGQPVPLPPKATRVLVALASSPGRLLTHEALYEVAWEDTVVAFDQGLYTCIRQIRQALGDEARQPRYIETIPRRGYRFCYTPPTGRSCLPAKPRRRTGVRRAPAILSAALVVVVGVLVLFGARYGLDRRSQAAAPPIEDIALADFRIDGFSVSTGGIDQRLESSVRSGFLARGVALDRPQAGYLVQGRITPAEDGASFQVSLVRLADGVVVWENTFNPFCPEVEGDPVRVIGHLVARIVIAQVAQTSA